MNNHVSMYDQVVELREAMCLREEILAALKHPRFPRASAQMLSPALQLFDRYVAGEKEQIMTPRVFLDLAGNVLLKNAREAVMAKAEAAKQAKRVYKQAQALLPQAFRALATELIPSEHRERVAAACLMFENYQVGTRPVERPVCLEDCVLSPEEFIAEVRPFVVAAEQRSLVNQVRALRRKRHESAVTAKGARSVQAA